MTRGVTCAAERLQVQPTFESTVHEDPHAGDARAFQADPRHPLADAPLTSPCGRRCPRPQRRSHQAAQAPAAPAATVAAVGRPRGPGGGGGGCGWGWGCGLGLRLRLRRDGRTCELGGNSAAVAHHAAPHTAGYRGRVRHDRRLAVGGRGRLLRAGVRPRVARVERSGVPSGAGGVGLADELRRCVTVGSSTSRTRPGTEARPGW